MLHQNTPWIRSQTPVLSALAADAPSWMRSICYSPSVVRVSDKYLMTMLGSSGPHRSCQIDLGIAESDDGLSWSMVGDQPVLRANELPFEAVTIQTPHVLWDEPASMFRLWFIAGEKTIRDDAGQIIKMTQKLAYAESPDGRDWRVHPQPVFYSGRRPCVHALPDGGYRMWMNSESPAADAPWNSLYQHIYEFRSPDGKSWTRSQSPCLTADPRRVGCIYPFVVDEGDRYFMYFAGYDKDSRAAGRQIFQIYSAVSADGSNWNVDVERPAFPVSDDVTRFDALYTSTPCVVVEPDRYLLYYSAVDTRETMTDIATGVQIPKKGSAYQHIGVATAPRNR